MATSSTQELRRIMKQQKTSSKKLVHPLAKYNNLDQIVCIVCNNVVKNEIIWKTHLQSRRHKENIQILKSKTKKPEKKESITVEAPNIKVNKKPELPADFFDSPSKTSAQLSAGATTNDSPKKTLPQDFFDEKVKESESKVENLGTDSENTEKLERKRKLDSEADKLPEGFFDDPRKDAKARNVEYKDPKEDEWEKFQRMIEEETKVAEAIRTVEDEEAEMMKDMDELNNMKLCLTRVDKMKKLVHSSMSLKPMETDQANQNVVDTIFSEDDDDDDGDNEDLDTLFNWRAKAV